jgi:hypothetical protein
MSKNILESVCELEGVDIPQTELDVGINNKLGETKNFTTKMEGISETGFFSFFRGQGLDRLEIHIVIEMEVVQILEENDYDQPALWSKIFSHTFRWIKRLSILYPCRQTCKPASTQSSLVVWKNLVALSWRNRFFLVMAFSGRVLSSFKTKHLRSFW